MPADVAALVTKGRPNQALCRAYDHEFSVDGIPTIRGIVSYYAAKTLPDVKTVGEWIGAIHRAAAADTLPPLKDPALQLLGDPSAQLPGSPLPG